MYSNQFVQLKLLFCTNSTVVSKVVFLVNLHHLILFKMSFLNHNMS